MAKKAAQFEVFVNTFFEKKVKKILKIKYGNFREKENGVNKLPQNQG